MLVLYVNIMRILHRFFLIGVWKVAWVGFPHTMPIYWDIVYVWLLIYAYIRPYDGQYIGRWSNVGWYSDWKWSKWAIVCFIVTKSLLRYIFQPHQDNVLNSVTREQELENICMNALHIKFKLAFVVLCNLIENFIIYSELKLGQ